MERLAILPGLMCDSRMFEAQIAAFDALVIDGFYGRVRHIEEMAEYAIERLPEGCALLGHSMGARVALEIWRLAPDRIARLALADTGIHPVRSGEAAGRYRLRDLGRAHSIEALVDEWLPPMIGRSHLQRPELVAALRAMAINAGVETFEAQTEAMLSRPDAGVVLPTITCPVMVAVGRDDEWSPVAQHEAIAARIGDARLRIIENAGHMAPAEEPERFNKEIREWLSWPFGGVSVINPEVKGMPE